MIKALKSERLKVNIILSIIILLFSQLLCYEVRKRLSSGDREPIGKIIMKLKDAKRKMSSEVVFENVDLSFDIYNLDTLKTSEYSEAIVQLKDGTEIKLEENTMVVFSFADDTLNIDFARGGLKVDSGNNKVKLKSDENKFTIENGKLSLNKKSGKVVELNIQEGKVDLTKDGTTESLSKDSVVQVKEERVLKTELIARPIFPVSEYIPSSGKDKLVEFNWSAPEKESSYILEIKNADNSKLVVNQEVSGGKFSTYVPIGNYRWKLIPKNKSEAIPPASKFAIVSSKPVIVNKPSNGAKFTYVKKTPSIIFQWIKEDFFNKYILEISQQSDFSKLEFVGETFNEATLVNSLPSGKYFFRVRAKPILSNMEDKFSETREFEIQSVVKPAPIQLVSPEQKKEFYKNKNQGYQNTFVWKKGPEFDSYVWEMSKTIDFSNIIKKETTNDHYYYLKEDIAPGTYYWRVKGLFKGDEIVSETRSFYIAGSEVIKLIGPINSEELEFGAVEFSWVDSVPGASYNVELSKSPNFQNDVKKFSAERNFLSIPSPGAGKYFWRVSLKDSNYKSNRQEIGQFSIRPEPAPEILFPKDRSEVDLSPVSSITLEWQKINTGISYDMELYSISQGKKIISLKGIKDTSYSIQDLKLLKRGDYELFVQARFIRKGEEITSKKTRSRFTIILSQTIKKEDVKFITPEEVYFE
jgi:hypothetical protein